MTSDSLETRFETPWIDDPFWNCAMSSRVGCFFASGVSVASFDWRSSSNRSNRCPKFLWIWTKLQLVVKDFRRECECKEDDESYRLKFCCCFPLDSFSSVSFEFRIFVAIFLFMNHFYLPVDFFFYESAIFGLNLGHLFRQVLDCLFVLHLTRSCS